MKNITKALLIFLILILICSCNSNPSPYSDRIDFYSEIDVLLASSKKRIYNTYKTEYFRQDARTYNKDLALLSYALAASDSPDNAVKTLNSMQFGNLDQHWNNLDLPNSCSFVIGQRKIDSQTLVAVYIKGIGYNAEWAGNLTMGQSGNHVGFETAAEEVLDALKQYLDTNCPNQNFKLWITGYSRGAAITNVLAVSVLNQDDIPINTKDLFVYSFEPPASVKLTSETEDYSCIHNIYAESDLVAAIPPTIPSADYGLVRPGVEYKMASDPQLVNACLHKHFGSDVNMPEFVSSEIFSTPAEFLEYFVEGVTSAATDPDAASLESREKFYSTIQERITYLAEVLMGNNRAGLNALMDYIKENEDQLVTIILKWITVDGAFYENLSAILDNCGVEYDDTKLQNACTILQSVVKNTNLVRFLLGFVTGTLKTTNVMYLAACHYPEVCYVLLKESRF